MKKTRICDLLHIEYPIIQAPMAWVAGADLAAAVSNAGGLGTIGPNAGCRTQEEANDLETASRRLREEIRKANSLTAKPFAVNFAIGRGKQAAFSDRFVEIGTEERVKVAVVSMGSSQVYTARLKAAGMKVLHAIGSVDHARKAEADGVDAVICEGYEAGGHLGGEELTTMVLTPQIAEAVRIPLIAGGGVVDARGVVAALALGAEAVYMGTRFLPTAECSAHPRMKQAVINAIDTSTVAFGRMTGLSRCIKNEYTRGHLELEKRGASFEEVREYERSGAALAGWRRIPAALVAGNIEHGATAAGAASGLIRQVASAAEVIRQIVAGVPAVIARME